MALWADPRLPASSLPCSPSERHFVTVVGAALITWAESRLPTRNATGAKGKNRHFAWYLTKTDGIEIFSTSQNRYDYEGQ
jgi:hypothetical protein